MKQLSHMLVWIGAGALFLLGCEQHDFDKTKILHADHGHHDGHHGDHSKDGHGDEGHGEKKSDHGKGGAHGESHGEGGKKEAKAEEPRDVGI